MTEAYELELKKKALKVREHIIKMSGGGGCFIGASLSAVEVIVYLYDSFLKTEGENRDTFFLSKGHDVPALYGTFVETGRMEKSRLENHLKVEDDIYWHPNRKIEGVEFHSGSLGHLLSVSVGIAMDAKMKGETGRVVVMVGDGELNEGSNWEAMLVANAYHLDNLVIVVDRNQFQANIATEDLIPLEPLADKFKAFGISPVSVDGHDFSALEQAFQKLPLEKKQPTVIISNTKRGKGLPSIEARADRWFCRFSDEEVSQLLKELHGQSSAELTSETLVVR